MSSSATTLREPVRSIPLNPVDRRCGHDRREPARAGLVIKQEFIADVFGAMEDCDLKQDAAAAIMGIDPATLSRIKTGSQAADPKTPKLPAHLLDLLPHEWQVAFTRRRMRRLEPDEAPAADQNARVLDLLEFMCRLTAKVVEVA